MKRVVKRMTGDELAAMKAAAGVTDAWVAGVLGVRVDTVKKWRKDPEEKIPPRLPVEVAVALRELASERGALADGATEWADRLETDYSLEAAYGVLPAAG